MKDWFHFPFFCFVKSLEICQMYGADPVNGVHCAMLRSERKTSWQNKLIQCKI